MVAIDVSCDALNVRNPICVCRLCTGGGFCSLCILIFVIPLTNVFRVAQVFVPQHLSENLSTMYVNNFGGEHLVVVVAFKASEV